LASTKKCERCTEVLRVGKLLWFVKNFIRIAKLFYKIIRKNVKWNWRERQQKVFEKLKKRFTIEPVLVIPDLDKNIRVKVKVSDFAIDRVL